MADAPRLLQMSDPPPDSPGRTRPARRSQGVTPWPADRPEWWRGHVLVALDGLTRTRLTAASAALSRRLCTPEDTPRTLFARTHAVLAVGLDAHAAREGQGELTELGLPVAAFDTAAVLPCPRAWPVDEARWDEAGLRLRTALGVHAVAWRDVLLALLAGLGPERTPTLEVVTRAWERFRLTDPLDRLAAALLDRATGVAHDEALTVLSVGRQPQPPHFPEAADHEAWTALWLARVRAPRPKSPP